MKWIVTGAIALLALAALVYMIGAALPKAHTARVERLIPAQPVSIAARIRNVRAYPEWRKVAVENVIEAEGAVSYVEISEGDRLAFRITEPEHDRRFVSEMTDETMPFGGTWTWTLEPRGDQTLVTIEEAGVIRNPVLRFFARFVFGYESTMQAYLDALEAAER